MSYSVTSGPAKQRRTALLLLNKLSFADDNQEDPLDSTSPSSTTMGSSGKRSSVDAGLGTAYSPRFSPPTTHQHLPAEVLWSRREDPNQDLRCVGTLHIGTARFPGVRISRE